MEQAGVIIVAAGKGTRMGTAVSKQYLPLGGKPVLVHTVEVFQRTDRIHSVVLVIGAGDEAYCAELVAQYGLSKVTAILTGGADRQESVYCGLQALDPDVQWVLVHDAVRPFVSVQETVDCLDAAILHGAAVLAVPVKDTVKIVGSGGIIESTPDRSTLWAIQTPQTFRLDDLLAAHELASREGFRGTDDAMLIERTGQPVHVVEGSYFNIKITTPEDLEWAEYRISQAKEAED